MLEFYDTTFCTSTIGGNARWAAPEIYHITIDNVVPSATTQSDVYSLGCIMLQVRRPPFHLSTHTDFTDHEILDFVWPSALLLPCP
jgi:serine/threonine protein kinase